MPDRELWRLPAVELSALIGRKEVSPVELLDMFLQRCERLNPVLNAIIAFDREGARRAAEAAERRMREGARLGPLDGLPVTIKDNIFVEGFTATWGSLLYRDFRPPQDDIAVARLRAAGAVIFGRTNTPEFALQSFTDNRVFGPTRNPWNLELTPGGSSGGAVAAVAAGLAPLALGTDAGGSIRRPASYAGVVGLRPSTGRVARVHGFPPMAHDFQAITPAARTVADTGLLYRCIAGPDPRDRLSLVFNTSTSAGIATRRLRIRHVTGMAGAPIDREITAAIADAAQALRELGHVVEEGAAPYELAQIDEIWSTLTSAGLARVLSAHPDWRDKVYPATAAAAERGPSVSGERYVRAIDAVNELRRRMPNAFEAFDVLLMPASAALPWRVGEPYPSTIDGREAGPRAAGVFATFVNAAGLPAISIPAAPAASGLPIGVQLVGRFGEDDALLALANEFEAARPWAARWPALASGA
ncbi:MAG TPA: amidase [Burkholderiales bacterium]|nr:amidase [Burkholderiales bacterium]